VGYGIIGILIGFGLYSRGAMANQLRSSLLGKFGQFLLPKTITQSQLTMKNSESQEKMQSENQTLKSQLETQTQQHALDSMERSMREIDRDIALLDTKNP